MNIICGFAVILLDIITKRAAIRAVGGKSGQRVQLLSKKLYLTIVKNRGAAYNIGSEQPGMVKLLSAAAIVLLVCYVAGEPEHMKTLKLGGAFAAGGGAANLLDRMMHGYVLDFIGIDYENAPVFNVADLFILAGTVLMIYGVLKK